MHIKVHIEVNERGYAYTGDPNGEQNIDLEVSEVLGKLLDVSNMVSKAVELSVNDYLEQIKNVPAEEIEQ